MVVPRLGDRRADRYSLKASRPYYVSEWSQVAVAAHFTQKEFVVARIESRLKLGYFPLDLTEARRIRAWLSFPEDACAATLDPCAGTGKALAAITEGANVLRYGIELDSFRAEEAKATLDHVVQGNCFDVHCAVESYGLLFLNPPYDFECSEGGNERTESLFLEHCFRWLQPGGVLVDGDPGAARRPVRSGFGISLPGICQ